MLQNSVFFVWKLAEEAFQELKQYKYRPFKWPVMALEIMGLGQRKMSSEVIRPSADDCGTVT